MPQLEAAAAHPAKLSMIRGSCRAFHEPEHLRLIPLPQFSRDVSPSSCSGVRRGGHFGQMASPKEVNRSDHFRFKAWLPFCHALTIIDDGFGPSGRNNQGFACQPFGEKALGPFRGFRAAGGSIKGLLCLFWRSLGLQWAPVKGPFGAGPWSFPWGRRKTFQGAGGL